MNANWKPIGTHPVDTNILVVKAGYHPKTGAPYIPTVASIDEEGNVTELDAEDSTLLSDWGLTHWDYLPKNPAEVANED